MYKYSFGRKKLLEKMFMVDVAAFVLCSAQYDLLYISAFITLTNRSRYSRMDQVKFVEDSL